MSWTEQTASGSRSWRSVASSSDGTKLVACVYEGQIWTSIDSGVKWTEQKPTQKTQNWQSVASDASGTNLVACVNGGQIWTSTNSGESWTTRDSNRTWFSVASSSDGKNLVACVNNTTTNGYIYTSTDYGENWTPRKTDANRNWTSVASSSDGVKLVACVNDTIGYGYIYTSTNSGVYWNKLGNQSNEQWQYVASSSDGKKLVACNYNGYIYTSTDSGGNFLERATKQNWTSVASNAGGDKLVACVNGGYIYISTDSGGNWSQQITDPETNNWNCVASSSDGNKLVAGSGGYIYTYTAPVVTSVKFRSGSLITQFLNNDVIVSTFTTIPGNLDTTMLEDGDYSDSSIFDIFEHLKNYSYNDSIFDNITYNLAAFFTSIAYEQAYVKIINEELTPLFVSGKITKEQYDIALKVSAKELSDKYPIWYFVNVAKIQKAIVKYKYVLNQK